MRLIATRIAFGKILLLLMALALMYTRPMAAQVTTISSISPLYGKAGDQVTITGTNYQATASSNLILFGAVATSGATVNAGKTQLTVKVPNGATYGQISVMGANGTYASSSQYFTVIPGSATALNNYTFTAPNSLTLPASSLKGTGSLLYSLVNADFDNNGKSDLLISRVRDGGVGIELYIAQDTGTSSFASFRRRVSISLPSSFPSISAKIIVKATDLNNDGKRDILIIGNPGDGNTAAYMIYYKNTSSSGTISFDNPYLISLKSKTTNTFYNLLNTNDNTINFSIASDGNGLYNLIFPAVKTTTDAYNVKTTTVPDIYYVSGSVFSSIPSSIEPGLFNSTINFSIKSTDKIGGFQVVDLDNDGKLDLSVIIGSGTSWLLKCYNDIVNTKSSSISTYTLKYTPYTMIVGDLNKDGRAEILLNYTNKAVLDVINYSSSSISAARLKLSTNGNNTAISDVNGDGIADILSSTSGQHLNVLKSLKSTSGALDSTFFDGALRFHNGCGSNYKTNGLICADINNDGSPEVIYISAYGGHDSLRILQSIKTAPQSLYASVKGYSGKVGLSWKGIPNEPNMTTSYDLYRNNSYITTTTDTVFFDNVVAGLNYSYTIKAYAKFSGADTNLVNQATSTGSAIVSADQLFTATDSTYSGSPYITLRWKPMGQISQATNYRYKIYRDKKLLDSVKGNSTFTYKDTKVNDGQYYNYIIEARQSIKGKDIVAYTAGDPGFCYQLNSLLSASDGSSDAYISVKWSIPLKCLQDANGASVYSTLTDSLGKTVYYKNQIDTFSPQPYVKDSIKLFVGDNKKISFKLNLYQVGTGASICSSSFYDAGYTAAFQQLQVDTTSQIYADKIVLKWKNTSDLPSVYRIYRNGVVIKTIDGKSTTFTDAFSASDTSGSKNGKSYKYTVEPYNSVTKKTYDPITFNKGTYKVNFTASRNKYANQVQLNWNNLSKYCSYMRIVRDGIKIAQLDSSVSNFIDNAPVYGKRHIYNLELYNAVNQILVLSDTGCVPAIGKISGRVSTLSGDIGMPNVKIKAVTLVGNDSVNVVTYTDKTGKYSFDQLYFGTESNFTITAQLANHKFQVNPKTITLNYSNTSVANTDFADMSAISTNGSASITIDSFKATNIDSSDLVLLKWKYTSADTTYFKIYRDNVLLDLVMIPKNTSGTYVDQGGIPGTSYTYKLNAYVWKKGAIKEVSSSQKTTFPNVASVLASRLAAANDNNGAIKLRWKHSSHNFSGFYIYNSPTSTIPIAKLDTLSQTYVDYGGVPGNSYTYAIQPFVIKSGRTYTASISKFSGITYPPLPTPSNIRTDTSLDYLLISFTQYPGAGYNFDWFSITKTFNGKTYPVDIINAGLYTYLIDYYGKAGQTYTYNIQTYKKDVKAFSTAGTLSIKYPRIYAPTNLSIQSNRQTARLTWTSKSARAEGAIIIRDWKQGTNLIKRDTFYNPTIYSNYNDVLPINTSGSTYSFTYYVALYRKTPEGNDYSNFASASINKVSISGKIASLDSLTASSTYRKQVVLRWAYPSYITSTFIIVKNGKFVDSVSSEKRSWYDYSVQPDVNYTYGVYAKQGASISDTFTVTGRLSSRNILMGTVTYPNGVGEAGVRVVASGYISDLNLYYYQTGITDSSGSYIINNLPETNNGVLNPGVTRYGHTYKQTYTTTTIHSGQSVYVCDFVDNAAISSPPVNTSMAVPQYVSATPNANSKNVTIRWTTNSSNYSGFKVFRGTTQLAIVYPGQPKFVIDSTGYPGYSYLYSVRAFIDKPEGRKESNSVGVFAVFPEILPVRNLEAAADAAHDQNGVFWSHEADNNSYYEVKRNGQIVTNINCGQKMNWLDTNAVPGQSQTYTVRTVQVRNGSLFYSPEATITCTFPNVAPVTNLVADTVSGANNIHLSWKHVSKHFDGYHVFRDRKLIATLSSAVDSGYKDYGFELYSKPVYMVQAFVKKGGQTYISYPAYASYLAPSLAYPLNLKAAKSNSGILLSWNYKYKGYDHFRIYRKMPGIKLNTLVAELPARSGTSFSYLDTGLIPGQTYIHSVSAVSQRITKWESQLVSVQDKSPDLMTPINLTGSNDEDDFIDIAWSYPATNNNGFIIYRNGRVRDTVNNAGVRIYSDIIPANSTDSSFDGTYHYGVAAYKVINGVYYLSDTSAIANGWADNLLDISRTFKPISGVGNFGYAVNLFSNYAVVGANKSNGSVTIYKYDTTSGKWSPDNKPLALIKPIRSSGAPDNFVGISGADAFGSSVALNGRTLVVGAPYYSLNISTGTLFPVSFYSPGRVYFYTIDSATQSVKRDTAFDIPSWLWPNTTVAKSTPIPPATTQLGYSVDVYGDVIAAGAPVTATGTNLAAKWKHGIVCLFQKSVSRKVNLVDTLLGRNVNGNIGGTVKVYKDTIYTSWKPTSGPGKVVRYKINRDKNNNVVASTLIDSITVNETTDASFGTSITVDDNNLIIGAPTASTADGTSSGVVYTFYKNGNKWKESDPIYPPNGKKGDAFGTSVSMDKGVMLVGANNSNGTGQVFVYNLSIKNNASTWTYADGYNPEKSNGTNPASFGQSVSVKNGKVLIGSYMENNNIGKVYWFNSISPAPPANFTASKGTYDSYTKLDWTYQDKTNIAYFEIYRSTISGYELIATLTNTSQTTYSDVDNELVEPGKHYVYSIYAIDNGGNYSVAATDVGYRNPVGNVKGSVVTYIGHYAVPGIPVKASAVVDSELYTYYTYTNSNGSYEFNNLYFGKAADYTISVYYPGHYFLKESQNVNITQSSSTVGASPFYDTTAIILHGFVSKLGMACGMDSVKMTLTAVNKNGSTKPKTTYTSNGNYAFVINPSDPLISYYTLKADSVSYVTHGEVKDTFVNYIKDRVITFNDLALITNNLGVEQNFYDTLRYPATLYVRNTCGPIPGVNNFYLRVHAVDGCFDTTVTTNDDGRVTVRLPALKYQISMLDVQKSNYYNLPVVRYLKSRPASLNLDSIAKANKRNYAKASALVEMYYHTAPVVSVTGFDRYICNDPSKGVLLRQNYDVTLGITVNEINNGQSCPVQEGSIKIRNAASAGGDTTIAIKSNHFFPSYTFTVGSPSTIYPFTKGIIFEYHTDNGGYQGETDITALVEGAINVPGNDIIVENDTSSNGQVQLPLFVLRDPPGDGSYSYIKTGTAFTQSVSYSHTKDSAVGLKVDTKIGLLGGNFVGSLDSKTGNSTTKSSTFEISGETTQQIQTSAITGPTVDASHALSGPDADIIVGAGIVMQYGISDRITYDNTKCIPVKSTFFNVSPNGIKTTWVYTIDQIKTLIAEYQAKKTAYLTGTDSLSGLSRKAAASKMDAYVRNWTQVLSYHDTATVPYYNLCSTNFDALGLSTKDLNKLKDSVNYFCSQIGSYTANHKFVMKNFTWTQDLIDRYNKAYMLAQVMSTNNYINSKTTTAETYDFIKKQLKTVPVDDNYYKTIGPGAENITFSGGTSVQKEQTVTKSSGSSYRQSWFTSIDAFTGFNLEESVSVAVGAAEGAIALYAVELEILDVFKYDVTAGFTFNFNFDFEAERSFSSSTSTTTGYVLADKDAGDQYSVTAIKGINNTQTPYFALLGGRSSCPEYPGTISRDQPTIEVANADGSTANANLYNQDPDKPAIIPLKISNLNPFGEGRTYQIYLADGYNKYNATIKVAGTTLGTRSIYIPAGQSVYVALSVERFPAFYNYDDIRVGVQSVCETYISAEIDLSVSFRTPCSNVSILSPADNWIMDAGKQNMIITLNDYDVNNTSLQRLVLEYRRKGANKWDTMAIIPRDTLKARYYKESTSPTNPPYFDYIWDITGKSYILDGQYEIHAKAICGGNVVYSNTISGAISRSGLQLIGVPQPSDGVLSLGDEISVSYSRDIDFPKFKARNFTLIRNRDKAKVNFSALSSYNNKLLCLLDTATMKANDGEILTASVDSVQDVNGAYQLRKISWSFKVNFNPVYLSPDSLVVNIYQGKQDTQSLSMYNSVALKQNYSLSYNNSAWLKLASASGIVAGTAGTSVPVYIDAKKLSPGKYLDTVNVFINGYSTLRMPVILHVLLPAPAWVVSNSNLYSSSVNVITNYEISPSTATSTDTMDIIAVSIGNEIRGVAKIKPYGKLGKYAAYITVYGNGADANKPLKFRVWKAGLGAEYDAHPVDDMRFSTGNSIYGSIYGPEILVVDTAKDKIRYIPLVAGWNWLSINTVQNKMSTNNILASLHLHKGDYIKTLSSASEYFDTSWVSINHNLDSMAIDSGYLLKLSRNDTLRISGANAQVKPFALRSGWNLIGYPAQKASALNNITYLNNSQKSKLGNGDAFKSDNAFAIYDSAGKTWTGSLTTLQPYKAYMVNVKNAGNITYRQKKADPDSAWTLNTGGYELNMNITGIIVINGARSDNQFDKVAAFVNGECRGVGTLTYVPELRLYMMKLFVYSNGNKAEKVGFKIFSQISGMAYNVPDSMVFTANQLIGSLSRPYVFSNNLLSSIQQASSIKKDLRLYPNPVEKQLNITFTDNHTASYQLLIYNSLGSVVYRQELHTMLGENNYNMDLARLGINPGFYFVQLFSNDFTHTEKILYLNKR